VNPAVSRPKEDMVRLTERVRRWGRLGVAGGFLWVLSLGAAAAQTGARAIETVPGMPPVPDPANLYSEAGAGQAEPGGCGRAAARLRAEREVQ
jgi:hypothetical protein